MNHEMASKQRFLFYGSWIDRIGLLMCVIFMSISGLFYIIFGQYLFAKVLRFVPLSGFQYGLESISFLILPVVISVFGSIGMGVRWYRILFLEEVNKDYVRFARGKGLSDGLVLFRHILKYVSINSATAFYTFSSSQYRSVFFIRFPTVLFTVYRCGVPKRAKLKTMKKRITIFFPNSFAEGVSIVSEASPQLG